MKETLKKLSQPLSKIADLINKGTTNTSVESSDTQIPIPEFAELVASLDGPFSASDIIALKAAASKSKLTMAGLCSHGVDLLEMYKNIP